MSSVTNTQVGEEEPTGSAAASTLSADEFQAQFFGEVASPTRAQPWKEQVEMKEQHHIHIVNDNLRLWGKHVAAHS